jgi:CO dehydrogenase maturation factor
MRIAFVGKGGSGKSTLTASFASYLSTHTAQPVVVFDADLNIHIPELLGFSALSSKKHLSESNNANAIKKWLISENDITDLGAFRKTTPPTRKSNILHLTELRDTPLAKYGEHRNNLSVFAVGTYEEDDIGTTCYHTSLSIFESILNHTDDKDGYIAADMVAGVDAFACTLHAQFDLVCMVVEPTQRSVEVYKKYAALAKEAGVYGGLMVVGNKVRDEKDADFISRHIPADKILGYFADDAHIRHIDQGNGFLEVGQLNSENKKLLASIREKLDSMPDSRNKRLQKIWKLHRKYVAQAFVTERFGDLTGQIDTDFCFEDSYE